MSSFDKEAKDDDDDSIIHARSEASKKQLVPPLSSRVVPYNSVIQEYEHDLNNW